MISNSFLASASSIKARTSASLFPAPASPVRLAALFGAASGTDRSATAAPGLLTVLTLVAGVVLLFTQRYPRSLFDLIVGFNRWQYRVFAYVFLMTDQYPPFRLDQGGPEPVADTVAPAGPLPAAPQPA